MSTTGEGQRRQHDFRPQVPARPRPAVRADWVAAMRTKTAEPEQSVRYGSDQLISAKGLDIFFDTSWNERSLYEAGSGGR